ncbi:ATP-dependent DNA helicase DinG [Halobacillus rhizosphaerae]|uniref:ATP-dependent DNA helicase DinG n=1 Tax=Halobacillus rhizosphaerae TaxID=3064889 RepID=UPI00398AA71C
MTTYAIVDLETTGNASVKGDRIIEIGVVVMNAGKVVEEFSSLVYPERDIPPFIQSLTGIEEEDVLNAPLFSEIAEDVHRLFHNAFVVAHNIEFDLGFLNAEFIRCGLPKLHNPVIDTVELARVMLPTAASFKLGQLAQQFNIGHDKPHRALSDAQVTSDLLELLLNKMKLLPERTLTHLLKVEAKLKSNLRFFIEESIEYHRYTADSEENYQIWHGIPVRKIPPVELVQEEKMLDFDPWLERVYHDKEGLSQVFEKYEIRSGQEQMSRIVYESFNRSEHALVEAGAGTGKSAAYLIGAAYYAISRQEKVVITTHTTSLQKQLIEDEIPKVEQLFSRKLRAVLYKGKSHYISLIHFSYELDRSDQDNYDISLTKAMVLVWLTETLTGDGDEIQLPSSGDQFWHKVSSEQSNKAVQLDTGNSSYFHLAQEKAKHADIIITNHALFCMDLMSTEDRLPIYDRVVVDEAHHLEAVASRHFGLQFNYMELQRQLSQFNELFHIQGLDLPVSDPLLYTQASKCKQWIDEAKDELNTFSRYLFQEVKQHHRKHKTRSDIGRVQYLINQNPLPGFVKTAKEMVNRFLACIKRLIRGMDQMAEHLNPLIHMDDSSSVAIVLSRLDKQKAASQQMIDQLLPFFKMAEEQVKWIEIESEGTANVVYLYSEPLDIAALLKTELFAAKASVVLTSATLTTDGQFNYIRETLGLEQLGEVKETLIPSPYPFKEQVQLMVPDDFPSIKSSPEEFIFSVSEAIYSIAHVTKGRMLVLFTSYDMLRKTYFLLKEVIDPEEFMVFAQGVSSGSRDRLKKNFQAFDQSILLGTSSFWEGVDIPGDDLSCLMIVRLPFQPPDQPVQSVRDDLMKEQGVNSFMERSLPNAIIRFKQGFGRLIRSSQDRGIVFVCDQRLMEARYGKYFISSIPDVPVFYQSTSTLIKQIETWL